MELDSVVEELSFLWGPSIQGAHRVFIVRVDSTLCGGE